MIPADELEPREGRWGIIIHGSRLEYVFEKKEDAHLAYARIVEETNNRFNEYGTRDTIALCYFVDALSGAETVDYRQQYFQESFLKRLNLKHG